MFAYVPLTPTRGHASGLALRIYILPSHNNSVLQIFKDRKKEYETAAAALKQASVEQEKAKLFSTGDPENKDEEEDVRAYSVPACARPASKRVYVEQ